MQNFRSILTGLQAGIAMVFGIVVANFDYFREYFKDLEPYVARYAFAGVLVLLFYLFRKSYGMADVIVEKIPGFSPALRAWMSGVHCVEGDWPLVVLNDKGGLAYLGFLSITYTGGQLRVAGRDWNPDGSFAHDFSSQQSRYEPEETVLRYWYKQGQQDRMQGFTQIYFFPKGEPVERHAGEFLDKEHNAARFYAQRTKYKRFERRPKSWVEKREAARRFWASIEPNVERIASHPLSSDWH